MNYYRIVLGRSNKFAEECLADGSVGVHFGFKEDLSGKLPDDLRSFNRAYIPVFIKHHPDKSKVAAGLACGKVWTVCKGLAQGDIVLCPDKAGRYHVGEVAGEYRYNPEASLPQQRPVRWLGQTIHRSEMSEALAASCISRGTVCNVTKHRDEIDALRAGRTGPGPKPGTGSEEEAIQDTVAFVMEKHLEDFLVENWAGTELGHHFEIYEEEGERVGQQYPTDTGPIDILAVSKDGRRLLVVELKKGRASDAVVGQTLRYMSYVQEELADGDQRVEGVVIALEDDQRLRRALGMVPAVSFYRYEVTFRLVRG